MDCVSITANNKTPVIFYCDTDVRSFVTAANVTKWCYLALHEVSQYPVSAFIYTLQNYSLLKLGTWSKPVI